MREDTQEGEVLLDKYEIMEKIGQGGTGSVYRAYDRHLRRIVAVKQIAGTELGGLLSGSLRNEVEVLKQMKHPALPEVYDYFSEGEYDYMVLEYIQGMNLEDYIVQNGSMDQEQAVVRIKELLSVLYYLHSFRPPVIYGDLKPANIIVRGDGHLKLIDFGAAVISYDRYADYFCDVDRDGTKGTEKNQKEKALKEKSYGEKSQNGMEPEFYRYIGAGTPGFSAPELLKHEKSTHVRRIRRENSDVYSVGAVFHYMLTGAKPDSFFYVRRPVREYDPVISDGLEKVIIRCLREEPERRYPNIQQLQQDMDHFKELEKKRIVREKISRAVYLIFMATGILLSLVEAKKGICLPLLLREGSWVWDMEYQLPDKLVCGLALILVGTVYKIIFRIRKKPLRRQEKSICLTEKKGIGLWGASLLIGLLLIALFFRRETVYAGPAMPAEITEMSLPVVIRDQDGYKLLIREEAVYKPAKDMILELPLAGIPKEEELVLQVVVSGEKTLYKSRKFLIRIPVDR